MPEISRFLGIVIKMFFSDHAPPHFHAEYGDYKAIFSIDDLGMTEGNFPPKARSLVIEWASLNQEELRKNWESMNRTINKTYEKIKPLN